MKPEWILENADERRWRGWLAVILIFAMILVTLNTGMNYGEQVTREQYDSVIAERDETILAWNEAYQQKEAELTEKEAEIRKIRGRAITLDENGVRTDRMREVYLTADPYRDSEIQTDAEFREYCQKNFPEAVWPKAEWTAEEIVVSWLEIPGIWGVWRDSYNDRETYFVWSAGYEHCFYLDVTDPILPTDYWTGEHRELASGWLVMDGVRILMIDQETYDVDNPYEMLQQYQDGLWDGSMRRSRDGSTTVEVSGGCLEYCYEAWRYDQSTDPLGMAYEGFAELPWWQREGLSEALQTALGERNQYAAWDETQTLGHSWLWRWDFYVDLPGGISGKVQGLGEVYACTKCAEGAFFTTSTGVWLYDKGTLVDSWEGKLEKESAEFTRAYSLPKTAEGIAGLSAEIPETDEDDSGPAKSEQQIAQEYAERYAECRAQGLVSPDDRGYLEVGEELLVLKEGGKIEPFFDQVVDCSDTYRSVVWGLKDGRLVWWRGYVYATGDLPKVVAEDVLEASFEELALFMKADGCYAVIWDRSGHKECYLGPESMDYYKRFYQTLRGATYY